MFVVVLGSAVALARGAVAQAQTTRDSIELAVARYIHGSLPHGRVGLVATRGHVEPRTRGQMKALLKELGPAVTEPPSDSLMTCSGLPSSCRLHGVDAELLMNVELLSDSSARATVTTRQATELRRVPIYVSSRTWVLSRRGREWVVDRLVAQSRS